MEFEDFRRRLDAVRAATSDDTIPEDFSPFDLTPASEDEILAAEEALGLRLPAAYKQYMNQIGAGSLQYLDLLPLTLNDGEEDSLVSVNTGEFKIPGFVAISPVGTGDWWGFPVTDGMADDRVLFWDHEDGSFEQETADFFEFLDQKGLSLRD